MTRNVVFVAPFPSDITMRFVRATAKLDDVKLLGVVHTPPGGSDERVFADQVRVENPLETADLIAGVEALSKRHGAPVRIIGILEAMQVQLAQVRAHFGVPGASTSTAALFRDKSHMKAALTKAGLPVAKNRLLRNAADAKAFAHEVGFPMVLKPPAGMGGKSTFRMRSLAELGQALEGLNVSASNPVLAEEFLQGREFSFETITVGGVPRLQSISHYHPGCLEAIENPWIQWCCILPRDISGPEYDGARAIGAGAIKALGLSDGMTHMEWFQRPDGSLAIGEIAMRPPGANISLMTGYAHDQDLYRAWARAVVDNTFDGTWERKYAVGTAFLRGMGRGRIAGVTGVAEVQRQLGPSVVEAKLPTIGAHKNDSYEGDGYVVVRDPSTEVVKKLLSTVINTIRVHYAA
jgi:formate-dependent phosphoribosylglycinamide formyltransferase (GAR transformylase)